MKLYYPKYHYKPHRLLVFPLLRPFIKGDGFNDTQRVKVYGLSEKDFEFVENLEDADLAILTMAWNIYNTSEQQKVALEFIKKCEDLGKTVIAVNKGDFGVPVPNLHNLIVFRASGYKSKFNQNEYVNPPFIKDPLRTYFNRDKIMERSLAAQPKIGFCGQANSSYNNAAKEIFSTILRNLKFYSGLSQNEPQQILSTTFLRASILRNIEKSNIVITNFIIRNKYRGGINNQKTKHETTLEFYNNLNESDYIICVRGAGNFSIRFYETLAMGRIPIFINTDCALPFDEIIDWKKHVVWVEYTDRSKVAEKVADFHQRLTKQDFLDLQRANRKLWEESLTLRGFYKTFFREWENRPF